MGHWVAEPRGSGSDVSRALKDRTRRAPNAPETYHSVVVFSCYLCADMQGVWRKFSLAACFDLIILVSSTMKYEGADSVTKLTFNTSYELNA